MTVDCADVQSENAPADPFLAPTKTRTMEQAEQAEQAEQRGRQSRGDKGGRGSRQSRLVSKEGRGDGGGGSGGGSGVKIAVYIYISKGVKKPRYSRCSMAPKAHFRT